MFKEIKKPLFIFEMANNHMGDLEHGKLIISEIKKVCEPYWDIFSFAFKLQLRDLSIIHPDYKTRDDIKMVKRLNDTRLTEEEFKCLKDEIKKQGFVSICTPFDEPSVEKVVEYGFDVLKIASCSCADWPLMEVIGKTNLPIIFSTGGAKLEDIDAMTSFLEHRKKDFAIMHCIGEYPTKNENLNLNQIDLLSSRYKNISVGFSTHENPDNLNAIKIAIAKGCMIFERHVGLKTNKYDINGYSSQPDQIEKWLTSAHEAYQMLGVKNERMQFSEGEIKDLNNLYRGVFLKKDIAEGEKLSLDNVFFAMPIQPGQLASRDFSKYSEFYAKQPMDALNPVMIEKVKRIDLREKVGMILKQMAKMLKNANVIPPDKVEMSISAHYGLDEFYNTGVILIDVLNREYCKKLLVMMPGQKHPTHLHKIKEETFHVLSGDFIVDIEGTERTYQKGDICTVFRGQKHSFRSNTGAIIEEISTTHNKTDSYYDDESIMNNPDRKIQLTYWSDFINLE